MYDIFWEMAQQANIDSASTEASRAKQEAASAAARVVDLASENQRLLLIIRALWEIMQAQHGLTEEILIKKVEEIDLRDGVLDGKYVKQEARTCKTCGRVMNRKHRHCLYCGARPAPSDAFGG